jgi:hypothetical protein
VSFSTPFEQSVLYTEAVGVDWLLLFDKSLHERRTSLSPEHAPASPHPSRASQSVSASAEAGHFRHSHHPIRTTPYRRFRPPTRRADASPANRLRSGVLLERGSRVVPSEYEVARLALWRRGTGDTGRLSHRTAIEGAYLNMFSIQYYGCRNRGPP